MELKKLQNQIHEIFVKNAKRDDLKITNDYLLIKLTEELGEFAQAYLIHNKQCRPVKKTTKEISKKEVSKELSDLIGIIFVVASELNIDLEEAIEKKWITREWIKK